MAERDGDADPTSDALDAPGGTTSDGDGEGEAHGGSAHEGDTHETHHHEHDVEDGTIGVAIVTVSTSRNLDDDPGGDAAAALVRGAGHEVVERTLIPDDRDRVQSTVADLVRADAVAAVVTSGGTGVTPDDVTVDAVDPLYAKRLPGFGELFRRRSADEIGTRAMLSRATAGVASADGRATPVFCLPGSESAVELGVGELVLPELGHVVGLARRQTPDADGEADADADADVEADADADENEDEDEGE